MTHTEKLLNKEFKIKSINELENLIDKKPESYFEIHFFTDSKTYKRKLYEIINQIDSDGDLIGIQITAMRTGSLIQNFASQAYSETLAKYKMHRKALLNHVRILISK